MANKRADLESAVAQPAASFNGDFYPTLLEKAAVLLRGIAAAHAFVDGNKRTAWYSMTTFLDLNGIQIDCDVREAADYVEAMAQSVPPFESGDIAEWLADHIEL
ncbi:type II toxin-antitoxin system death-on-curing family toxin [Pseudoclavibacter sp. RFBG4]|uniref:type II toxin-antitoxin system death-on-curing family toxin n=1 Tax=Pseudoclavibacter sp. RFBG4 TaxID=2080575 RepID=UPI000CE8A777|nr:type II toxin-antitoxin system death-on-curing family toxin [Pseudoclavibacter sp. RFBG4]PPG35202.1 type II toxin-antitoxin system death-on-curing family toxin [Pseudoclavibacter sp. RFBG4]